MSNRGSLTMPKVFLVGFVTLSTFWSNKHSNQVGNVTQVLGAHRIIKLRHWKSIRHCIVSTRHLIPQARLIY